MMKQIITCAFLLFYGFSLSSQSIGVTGSTNVCLNDIETYDITGGANCHGSGATRWTLDLEIVGGTIVSFTNLLGEEIEVDDSVLRVRVRRDALNNCNLQTPEGALACAEVTRVFSEAWIDRFTVEWNDNVCNHQIIMKSTDEFRAGYIWWTNGCSAENTIAVEVGQNNEATEAPLLWLPNNVCTPDCDNLVRICATSCYENAEFYEFSINGGSYYRSPECTQTQWQPNQHGKMKVCVKEVTNCGVTAAVCKVIELNVPVITGSQNPLSSNATYYLEHSGNLFCNGNIDKNSVTWRIWSDSWGANLDPIDGPGVNVEFTRNGTYTLEVCYKTSCDELKCISIEIVVTTCWIDPYGGESAEGELGSRSKELKTSELSVVNNLVERGENIYVYCQNESTNKLTMSDINGTIHSMDYNFREGVLTLNTSNLETGLYFISNGYTTAKIIIE